MKRESRPPSSRSAAPEQLTQDLAEAFFALLLSHRFKLQVLIGENGLSVPQFHTLMTLGDQALTMRELSKAAYCEPSHLTGIVDRLEEQGLVSRKASTEDRRSKRVSLTRSGTAFRKRMLSRLHEPADWMLAMPESEQQQLLGLLQKAISSLSPPSPPGTG